MEFIEKFCSDIRTPTEKLQEFIDSYPIDNDLTWDIIEGLKAEEEDYLKCYRKNSGNFYGILGSICGRKERGGSGQ